MLHEIKDPQDWYNIDIVLKNMMKNIPEFRHDYSKFLNNIELKVNELSKIDIELRRRHSEEYKQKRIEKLREINEAIRMFSKMHLLASLAKR